MESLENDYIKFWFEDGILHSTFLKQNVILDAPLAKNVITLRHEASNGEKQYWCYDFRNIKSMPKDGKDYADKYGQEYLHAAAAIVDNHIQKFIVNLFISIKNPVIPFKAFTSKEKDVQWLNEIKIANQTKSI